MAVTLNLVAPATDEQIKKSVAELQAEIYTRQCDIELLRTAVKHYQKQCKHKSQETGHNERDGSWGNPCPTCGWSY